MHDTRRFTVPDRLALIVLANPNVHSLTHAMAQAAMRLLEGHGYAIAWHDLYEENFDPVQRSGELANTSSSDRLVERHCAELSRADLVLVFHPNWWGQPPAIMKGWIDRVFRLDTAYGYPPGVAPDGVPRGLLAARHAFVFNTSNTPTERERLEFGDPLEALWKRCIFGLCGIDNVTRRMVGPVSGSTPRQRADWIDEVVTAIREAIGLSPEGERHPG
jgi:putative NADPH-quinone reductase